MRVWTCRPCGILGFFVTDGEKKSGRSTNLSGFKNLASKWSEVILDSDRLLGFHIYTSDATKELVHLVVERDVVVNLGWMHAGGDVHMLSEERGRFAAPARDEVRPFVNELQHFVVFNGTTEVVDDDDGLANIPILPCVVIFPEVVRVGVVALECAVRFAGGSGSVIPSAQSHLGTELFAEGDVFDLRKGTTEFVEEPRILGRELVEGLLSGGKRCRCKGKIAPPPLRDPNDAVFAGAFAFFGRIVPVFAEGTVGDLEITEAFAKGLVPFVEFSNNLALRGILVVPVNVSALGGVTVFLGEDDVAALVLGIKFVDKVKVVDEVIGLPENELEAPDRHG